MKKITTEEFIRKSQDVHGDKYDYNNSFYHNIRTKIEIKCKEHNVIFFQNPAQHMNGKTSCVKCYVEKAQQTCLKNHGVRHAAQSPEIHEKMKNTCIKNHGVPYSMQSKEIKEKSNQVMLNKYGAKHALQIPEFLEKSKQTCLKNNGVKHPLQSSEIIKKMEKNNLSLYGVKNVFELETVKEKSKQTCLDRYDVEHASQSPKIKEKAEQTMLDNHGVKHALQSPKFLEKSKQTCLDRYDVEYHAQQHIDKKSLKLLNDSEYLKDQHYEKEKTLTQIGYDLQVADVTVGNYLKKNNIETKRFNQSMGERELSEYIKSLGYEVEINKRNIINPLEIDIFIPSLNKAIEYNGLYWHKNKGINYHINKTLDCAKQNIPLLHVWEDQWLNNQEEIKNIIIKFLLNLPQQKLSETITIDLATDNPQIYFDLGYIVQDEISPELYSDGVWDCGKITLNLRSSNRNS